MKVKLASAKMIAYLQRLLRTRDLNEQTRAYIQAQIDKGDVTHYRAQEWIVHLRSRPMKVGD